jgi:hypothetical protein
MPDQIRVASLIPHMSLELRQLATEGPPPDPIHAAHPLAVRAADCVAGRECQDATFSLPLGCHSLWPPSRNVGQRAREHRQGASRATCSRSPLVVLHSKAVSCSRWLFGSLSTGTVRFART